MSLPMWLARIRLLAGSDPGSHDFPCTHCGTRFSHVRARASHIKYCAKRLNIAKIPLNSNSYLPSSRADADIPLDFVLQSGRGEDQG